MCLAAHERSSYRGHTPFTVKRLLPPRPSQGPPEDARWTVLTLGVPSISRQMYGPPKQIVDFTQIAGGRVHHMAPRAQGSDGPRIGVAEEPQYGGSTAQFD